MKIKKINEIIDLNDMLLQTNFLLRSASSLEEKFDIIQSQRDILETIYHKLRSLRKDICDPLSDKDIIKDNGNY